MGLSLIRLLVSWGCRLLDPQDRPYPADL